MLVKSLPNFYSLACNSKISCTFANPKLEYLKYFEI